jgi:hypothetical protein
MEARYDITTVVTLSRGKAENPHVITNRWRAVFDVIADGRDAINLRSSRASTIIRFRRAAGSNNMSRAPRRPEVSAPYGRWSESQRVRLISLLLAIQPFT